MIRAYADGYPTGKMIPYNMRGNAGQLIYDMVLERKEWFKWKTVSLMFRSKSE